MPGLKATGTLSYNGYTFDGATLITVATEFIYDDAGRSIEAHKYTIVVTAVVTNDGSTGGDLDRDLLVIRKLLGESGKKLAFINKGFGQDLLVNVGDVRDIENGPTPQVLTWEPIGDDKAAQVVWGVSTIVPICVGQAQYKGVRSINWQSDYRINNRGETTRTLSGYIKVAVPGIGKATADRFRNRFSPPPIEGFTREMSWKTNAKKNQVDFSITDTEIPSNNPYPPDIPEISGTHSVRWAKGSGARLTSNIEMTISPKLGMSGAMAYVTFLTHVNQRYRWAQQNKMIPFLVSLEVTEDLYGVGHSFQAQYFMLRSDENDTSSLLPDLARSSGLFVPLGNSWEKWASSLQDATFTERGIAGLGESPTDDKLIDLCRHDGRLFPNNRRSLIGTGGLTRPVTFKNATPPKDESWMYHESDIEIYRKQPYSVQEVVQSPVVDEGAYDAQTPAPSKGPVYNSGPPINRGPGTVDAIIQRGGIYKYGVRLKGRATRAGHKIPRPELKQTGSRKPVEVQGVFSHRDLDTFFGVKVYQASWAIDYILDGAPGEVEATLDQQQLA